MMGNTTTSNGSNNSNRQNDSRINLSYPHNAVTNRQSAYHYKYERYSMILVKAFSLFLLAVIDYEKDAILYLKHNNQNISDDEIEKYIPKTSLENITKVDQNYTHQLLELQNDINNLKNDMYQLKLKVFGSDTTPKHLVETYSSTTKLQPTT